MPSFEIGSRAAMVLLDNLGCQCWALAAVSATGAVEWDKLCGRIVLVLSVVVMGTIGTVELNEWCRRIIPAFMAVATVMIRAVELDEWCRRIIPVFVAAITVRIWAVELDEWCRRITPIVATVVLDIVGMLRDWRMAVRRLRRRARLGDSHWSWWALNGRRMGSCGSIRRHAPCIWSRSGRRWKRTRRRRRRHARGQRRRRAARHGARRRARCKRRRCTTELGPNMSRRHWLGTLTVPTIQAAHIKPNTLWRVSGRLRTKRRHRTWTQLPHDNDIHLRRFVLNAAPSSAHLALFAVDVHTGPLKSWVLLLALTDEAFDVRSALLLQRRVLLRGGDLAASLTDFARQFVLVQVHRAAGCFGPVWGGTADGFAAIEGPSFIVGLGGVGICEWV